MRPDLPRGRLFASWLYWYFLRYIGTSPFRHSRAFDLKTAVSVTEGIPTSRAGRSRLPAALTVEQAHTLHAGDDAIGQAQIFARLMTAVDRKRGR
ncbi:MAG: hypothetical protein AAGN82_17810 [Myxococcota bacterium]